MLEQTMAYLQSQGLSGISIDFMPPSTPCIGLFCWDDIPTDDDTSTRYVQVQVRAASAAEAENRCRQIFALLDSGQDETPLPIDWPGVVIGKQRRGPILLDRTATTVTYYCEVALWGQKGQ